MSPHPLRQDLVVPPYRAPSFPPLTNVSFYTYGSDSDRQVMHGALQRAGATLSFSPSRATYLLLSHRDPHNARSILSGIDPRLRVKAIYFDWVLDCLVGKIRLSPEPYLVSPPLDLFRNHLPLGKAERGNEGCGLQDDSEEEYERGLTVYLDGPTAAERAYMRSLTQPNENAKGANERASYPTRPSRTCTSRDTANASASATVEHLPSNSPSPRSSCRPTFRERPQSYREQVAESHPSPLSAHCHDDKPTTFYSKAPLPLARLRLNPSQRSVSCRRQTSSTSLFDRLPKLEQGDDSQGRALDSQPSVPTTSTTASGEYTAPSLSGPSRKRERDREEERQPKRAPVWTPSHSASPSLATPPTPIVTLGPSSSSYLPSPALSSSNRVPIPFNRYRRISDISPVSYQPDWGTDVELECPAGVEMDYYHGSSAWCTNSVGIKGGRDPSLTGIEVELDEEDWALFDSDSDTDSQDAQKTTRTTTTTLSAAALPIPPLPFDRWAGDSPLSSAPPTPSIDTDIDSDSEGKKRGRDQGDDESSDEEPLAIASARKRLKKHKRNISNSSSISEVITVALAVAQPHKPAGRQPHPSCITFRQREKNH